MDYHQLLRDSLTRLPTVAATIDSVRKAVQDRGEIVILYFNFDRYSKVEEVYGWEKLDSVLETTGEAMRDFLSKSPLSSSRLMVAFPNDDDFVFFHVPQDDTPAATDAEITELTAGLKEAVSSQIERVHGEDIAALFDIFVGRSLVVYNPKLRLERQIYRGIREAANASKSALTGNVAALEEFRGRVLRVGKMSFPYITDMNLLRRLHYAGELQYEDLYDTTR